MPDGPRLLALQELDTTLDQLQHQRPRLGEVTAHAGVAAARNEVLGEISRLQAEIADAEASIAAAEAASADIAAAKARFEQQLKTIIAPREAEALMHQMAGLDAQRDELDEQELAAMERQNGAEAALAMAQAQLADRDGELAAAEAARDQAWAALDDRAAQLRHQRDEIAAQLSDSDRVLYDQARARHGGIGIAHLDGTRCTGCHLDLSRGEADQIKALPAGELAECPSCNRLLVR